jgi:AAA domain
MAATRRPPRRRSARPAQARNIRAVPDRPRIEVRRESLADFNESVNILLYGNSGVGKTVLSAFAPNATFLSTEKGVVAAKRAGSTAGLIRAPTWEHVEAGLDLADSEMGPEDWLIVDSGSKMQILLTRWWLGIQHSDNEARDLDVPQIQDHLKFQNMYMRFVDRIVDAGWNSIFICTAMHREDPEGESLVLPAITGKDYTISNYCSAQFDQVLYYGVARQRNREAPTIRRLLAETYPPYFAKDRYNVLPRWTDIEEGDYGAMADIVAAIMEKTPEERRAAKAAAATSRKAQ